MDNRVDDARAANTRVVPGADAPFDRYFDDVGYFAEPDGRWSEPTPTQRWQAYWLRTAAAWAQGDDPLRDLAARQGFVVRTAQARALGLSRGRARWLVGRGEWTAPGPGVLAPLGVRSAAPWRGPAERDAPDDPLVARRAHALTASGAALRNPDHVGSGRSAALMHGLPTFRHPQAPVLTAAPTTTLGRRGAVHARGAALTGDDVQDWFGAPVTTPARTVVDLARLDRWDGVIAADAALHSACVTPAELQAAAHRARGWPGVRRAREIIAFADARSESPLESLTRLRLHDDDFPAPELQVELAVPGRLRPYRVDFLWPDQRLILEVDGRVKYRGDSQWNEKGRTIALRKLGFRVERARWTDVVDDWIATSRMLWAALSSPSPMRWL